MNERKAKKVKDTVLIPQHLCKYVREQVTTLEWYVFTYLALSSVEPTEKSKKTVRVEGTVEVTSLISNPF